MDREQIERVFLEFRKGNSQYFEVLVFQLLDILVEELQNIPDGFDAIGLLALLYAITSYNKENQCDSITYVRKYIQMHLLENVEQNRKLDNFAPTLFFPAYHVTFTSEQFQTYLEIIKTKKKEKEVKNSVILEVDSGKPYTKHI